jgi:hypothetical protein
VTIWRAGRVSLESSDMAGPFVNAKLCVAYAREGRAEVIRGAAAGHGSR